MDKILEKKRYKKFRLPFLIAAVVCSILVWKLSHSDQSIQNISKSSVSTFEIIRGDFSDHIRLRGNVLPSKTIYLDSISGGRVEEKFIERGAFVKEGELLLKLSNPTLQLEVMSREAQVAEQLNFLRNTQMTMETNKLNLERDLIEIEYQLQQVNRQIERSVPLVSKGAIAKEDLTSLKEELEYLDKRRSLTIKRQKQESSIRKVQISQLQESANMLQQNLSFARQNLTDLLITAPVSGYLSNFDVDIGENKRVGERLGQIDIQDEYKVVVNVDEYYLNKVALNATANVSINGKIIASQIYKIDSRVINSQFQVDISLPQNIDSIKIGQTLNVDMFLGETIPNTLLIKQGSFYSTTGGHWVFVVDKEHDLAERRSIKLGRKNQEYYEVLAGLNEGEEVLISSYETFEQAKTVRLK